MCYPRARIPGSNYDPAAAYEAAWRRTPRRASSQPLRYSPPSSALHQLLRGNDPEKISKGEAPPPLERSKWDKHVMKKKAGPGG